MKLVDRTPVRECKASHTFAESNATARQLWNIFARNVSRGRVSILLVVKVNNARVEWDHVAHLVDENLERVLDIQRRTKRPGNLVKRINFTMRFLDLIVSDVRTALTSLVHIDFA